MSPATSSRPGLSVQDLPEGRTRALAYLVSEADNLSSAERGETTEERQDFKTTPLAPVFGRVTLDGEDGATKLRYHPRPLGRPAELAPTFPEEFSGYIAGEMNDLLKDFGSRFNKIAAAVDLTSFDCLVTHLMGLLHTYAWCVPANTQEPTPDVSLYDHLKTTAAIAACLYKYHASQDTLAEREIKANAEKFLLVAGDLSGIQRYIFDIATGGGGGVARRLRARSLFVQTMSEAATHIILQRTGLPLTNAIMSSGGKFYLLLPNLPGARETVATARKEIDAWLLSELNGEMAINLATVSFGHDGFEAKAGPESGFGQVLAELDFELQVRKHRPFAEVLAPADEWAADAFLRPTTFEGRQPCDSCRKFPAEQQDGLCERCGRDAEWGRSLPGALYVAFFDDEATGDLRILGRSVSLAQTPEFPASPYLVLKLNDLDTAEVARYPALGRYLANHIPRGGDFDCDTCRGRSACEEQPGPEQPAMFQCLAHRSEGMPLLGFLKADVDNLGKLFIFGLKRDQGRQYDTISRLTTFSRMLDTFFSGWIESLTRDAFRHCYTVFSGGDDLFLVGPWNEILDLAGHIRGDFARYTGNPQITLSAGVLMNKVRYPVSRAAVEVNDGLEASKRQGRNRITVLGSTLPWEEWHFARGEWEHLRMAVADEVSSGFVYSLLRYGDMWRAYRTNGDVLGLRFQPLLAYSIHRNIDPRKSPVFWAWTEPLIAWRPGEKRAEMALDNLTLIARLLITSKDGGRADNDANAAR